MSSTKQIYSGVPQGSILAPLLFKIFINDLPHQIQYSQTDLYADDCTLTAVGNTLTEIETNLNNDLKNIETWCQINKMKINPSKSTCMILATNQKRRTLPNDNLTLYISNEKLTNVPTHKLLGVIIDCELSWKGHADHIIKKINKNIFVFKKIKTLLTKTTRQLFCTAFILPHISYCCNIWGHCPETHKIAINRLLKQCARLILNKNISYPSHELFSTLKWLTLENKVQFETAVITYKSLNHLAPA